MLRELKDSDDRTSSANRAQYPFAASDDGARMVLESEVGVGKAVKNFPIDRLIVSWVVPVQVCSSPNVLHEATWFITGSC